MSGNTSFSFDPNAGNFTDEEYKNLTHIDIRDVNKARVMVETKKRELDQTLMLERQKRFCGPTPTTSAPSDQILRRSSRIAGK
jgi:hypothetical protein